MTLGQVAVAVGAEPRWVLNALTRLRVPRRYNEPLARRLALARILTETLDIALPRAFALAGQALHDTAQRGTWRHDADNGAIALTIDLPRFLSSYAARLSLSRSSYGERLRGRRPSKRKSAVERAKEYGYDVTLLHSTLRRTAEERLNLLNENMEVMRRLRGTAR